MRKTKKLELRLSALENDLREAKKKGLIGAAVTGGVILAGTVVSAVQKHSLKKSVSEDIDCLEGVILNALHAVQDDEAEEEDEVDDDATSSSEATVDAPNTTVAMSQQMRNLVQSLEALDFSDGFRIPLDILRGFIDLAFGDEAKSISFSHCEPTRLIDDKLISDECISFDLYTPSEKYRICIRKANAVSVEKLN